MGTDEYEFSNLTFDYETTQGQSTFTFHIEFNQDGETGTVDWEAETPSENVEGTDEIFKTQ